MALSSVARRYAKAIFELAVEGDRVDRVGEELALIRQVLSKDEELAAAFANPVLGRKEKLALVEALVAGQEPEPLLANALRLMADRARLGDVLEAARIFGELADKRSGRVRALVTSAVPLTDDEASRIADALKRAAKAQVVVERAVDPGIVAGVVARVGGTVFDGSVRSQLEQLTRQLKAQ